MWENQVDACKRQCVHPLVARRGQKERFLFAPSKDERRRSASQDTRCNAAKQYHAGRGSDLWLSFTVMRATRRTAGKEERTLRMRCSPVEVTALLLAIRARAGARKSRSTRSILSDRRGTQPRTQSPAFILYPISFGVLAQVFFWRCRLQRARASTEKVLSRIFLLPFSSLRFSLSFLSQRLSFVSSGGCEESSADNGCRFKRKEAAAQGRRCRRRR